MPAGGIKEGQSPQEAARAELREEIGYIFLAQDVELRQPAHEAAEVITIHHKPIAEVLHMAQTNQINDGSSALALLLCQPYL